MCGGRCKGTSAASNHNGSIHSVKRRGTAQLPKNSDSRLNALLTAFPYEFLNEFTGNPAAGLAHYTPKVRRRQPLPDYVHYAVQDAAISLRE